MKFNYNPNNLCDLFGDSCAENPGLPLYYYPDESPKNWQIAERSAALQRIKAISSYLETIGVTKGTSVAIISSTRPEWLEADFGIMGAGGVVISIYPSLPVNDVGYILFDSGCEIVFVENEEQLQKITKLIENEIPIPATEERETGRARISVRAVIAFETTSQHPFVAAYSKIISYPTTQEQWPLVALDRPDIASLVYTSGTTGPQKGVVQTHGNHLANIRQSFNGKLFGEGDSIFLLLPLAHSFEKLMSYIGATMPVPLYFSRITDSQTSKLNQIRILSDLQHSNATLLPIVPRILEKMVEGIIHKAANSKPLQMMLDNGAERGKMLRSTSGTISVKAKILWLLFSPLRSLIRKKLFGKKFRYAISGGAKLPNAVNVFFEDLGIEILQGYGLTETCVATHCNRPGDNKLGTVGPLLDTDIEQKTLEDGEICIRGPNVANGYFNRPTATKNAWDNEGWFKTGDLGQIRPDGCLEITGRKKEVIVTAGGKKIPPERIEFLFLEDKHVLQTFVYGDGKPFLVALIVPNKQLVQSMLEINDGRTWQQLCSDETIKSFFAGIQASANSHLASFETVKRFALIPDEFSVDNGLLTPTFKVKRPAVAKQYKELLESLYYKE